MEKYLGVKLIDAEPEMQDGKDGYKVVYPDGYTSWSPKSEFEKAYLLLGGDGSIISSDVVDSMLAVVSASQIDEKTTLVKAQLITGFLEYATSSCVDPKNYSDIIGQQIVLKKIKDNMWFALGFILQWGKYGLKTIPKTYVQASMGPSIGGGMLAKES